MRKKLSRMWVAPEFKKKLKKMAVDEDMKLSDLTKAMAKETNPKKKGRFKLDLFK